MELNRDRQLAIEIERRLRLRREQSFEVTPTNLAVSDNDETLIKGGVECSASNYDTSAAVDSLLDDNILTLKEDVVDKIDEVVDESSTVEAVTEEEAMVEEPQVDRKSSNGVPLSLTIDANLNTFNTDLISPSYSLHSSPSLGALDESRNQSLYFTPMSGRESFSPLPSSPLSGARLIRSNSYTIEKPSPLLLKHMEANGISIDLSSSPRRSPMSLVEFRKNRNIQMNTPRQLLHSFNGVDTKDQKTKNNLTKTSARKIVSANSNASLDTTVVLTTQYSMKTSSPMAAKSTKPAKSTAKPKSTNQPVKNGVSSAFKNRESILRSIYGTGKSNRVQVSAKKANSSTTSLNSVKVAQSQPVSRSQVNEAASTRPINGANGNISSQNYQNILAMIENQHANQMKALLQRQQEEQKRMQEEFLRQQEELLKKISDLVINKGEKQITPKSTTEAQEAKKSNEKMLIEEVNNTVPVVFDTNGNRVNRFTPESAKCIRRLYYDDKKLTSDDLNKSYPSSLSTVSSEPFEMYTIEEVRAATIIAAYTRGYLTRRLFKTTKVQNIVKTIRDTLLFILDLHYEGNDNESSADIELKSHLIQQVIHAFRQHANSTFACQWPETFNFQFCFFHSTHSHTKLSISFRFQLASASQNLHSIFVRMPMVERMDLIAKDREWQQFKMNRSKSSDNNKNHMFVNGNSHLARSQSARFEKKF